MYLNTRILPTTGYARVLLFMFIRRELGGTGTGCLFQFTYCVTWLFAYCKGGNFNIHIWVWTGISSAKEEKSGFIYNLVKR